jgi:hypothetical protein
MCVNGFIVALVALSSALTVVDSQTSSLRAASFDPIEEEEKNIFNRLLDPVKDVDDRERSIINGNDAEIGEYLWFGKYLHWYRITPLPSFPI